VRDVSLAPFQSESYRHWRENLSFRARGDLKMAWKTPRIVEVPVGMEINMYACAARK
jgi:coenzyme PQQ precursor peptide PqqA